MSIPSLPRPALALFLLVLSLDLCGCSPRRPADRFAELQRRSAAGKATAAELVELGEAYYLRGEPLKAAEAAFQARKADPRNAGAHNLIGLAYLESGQLDRARQAFLQAAGADPNLLRPRINLARVELLSGNAEAAVRILQPLTRSHEGSAETWLRLGEAQRALDQIFAASGSFQKALERDPGLGEAHLALGLLDLDQNQDQKARESLEKACELGVRTTVSLSSLALVLAKTARGPEDRERALKLLGEARNPDNPASNFARALIHQQVGEHREAAVRFRRVLELDPRQERALFGLAESQRLSGQAKEAAETMRRYQAMVRGRQRLLSLQERITAQGASPARLKEFGQALLEAGFPARALLQFQEWRRLAPGDPEPGRWIDRARRAMERPTP